nr:DarT ssDNA thymidine ADP-ribosyltransferase family protein [uncultured Selenomonas sp.]
MNAFDILQQRNVTRLCHFTKFQKLPIILSSEEGILASAAITTDVKDTIDENRYDGLPEYVCCSIQYPNSWFLEEAKQRNADRLFRDWVVLYISPTVLNCKAAKFSPGNASAEHGKYIHDRMEEINAIFADTVPTFKYPRPKTMLPSCPTDGQAEILIHHNIPRRFIIGIAVNDVALAKRVDALQEMNTADAPRPISIAPDIMSSAWSTQVKKGLVPKEYIYNPSEGY